MKTKSVAQQSTGHVAFQNDYEWFIRDGNLWRLTPKGRAEAYGFGERARSDAEQTIEAGGMDRGGGPH